MRYLSRSLAKSLLCGLLLASSCWDNSAETAFYQGPATAWCPKPTECVPLTLKDLWQGWPGAAPPAYLPNLCVQVDGSPAASFAAAPKVMIPVRRNTATGGPDLLSLVLWAVPNQTGITEPAAVCEHALCIGGNTHLTVDASRLSRDTAASTDTAHVRRVAELYDWNDPPVPKDGYGRNAPGWLLSAPIDMAYVQVKLGVLGQGIGSIQGTVDNELYECRMDAQEDVKNCVLTVPACERLQLAARTNDANSVLSRWIDGPTMQCTIPVPAGVTSGVVEIVPGAKEDDNQCSASTIRAEFALRGYELVVASSGRGQVRVWSLDNSRDEVAWGPEPASKSRILPINTQVWVSYQADRGWEVSGVSGCDTQISNGLCELSIKPNNPPVRVTFGPTLQSPGLPHPALRAF